MMTKAYTINLFHGASKDTNDKHPNIWQLVQRRASSLIHSNY